MNNTDSGKRILKGKTLKPIEEYVKGLSFENGLTNSFDTDFDVLVNGMTDIFSHCMSSRNVGKVLHDAIVDFDQQNGNFPEKNLPIAEDELRSVLVRQIKDALETYPRTFEISIELPSFRKPSQAMLIDVTPDIRFEFPAQADSKKNCVMVLSGTGYLDGHQDSPLAISILSKAKLLIFLLRSLNLIQLKSLTTRAECSFKDLIETENLNYKFNIPDGISKCFGGMALNLGVLLRRRDNMQQLTLSVMFSNLLEKIPPIQSLFEISNKSGNEYLLTAIEWYEDSHFVENETVAFLEVCIGFEAILQDDDGRMDDMTNRLCDRLAYTLANSRSERKDLSATYRSILTLRGKLVHSKQARLDASGRDLLHSARNLLKRLIESELKLASDEVRA